MGHTVKNRSHLETPATLNKMGHTLEKGHPMKKRLHCKNVGRTVKYRLNLEK